MFFRILAALIAVALIYCTYEIIATYSHYKTLHTPAAPFMAMNNDTGTIPVVQYIDLHCTDCKKAAIIMMDYAEKNPDVRYLLRPVFPGGEDRYSEVRTAIATGLQGKYWETMRAISLFDGAPDEKFYIENASFMDLDIDRLRQDVLSKEAGEITRKNLAAVNEANIKSTQALMVGKNLYYLQSPLTAEDVSRMVEAERQRR